MSTFFFTFSQTLLIIKELVKHENKFNRRKVFLQSIFRIFIFHERVEKVYGEHFSVVYTMKQPWNTYFMKFPTLWNISFRLFMKCVFHDSFIVLNYREMFMIHFLRHFMKYKNSENRFSEFSLSWKT